ncbi:MAG: hypothetical protein FJ318_03450 [SAR202 cluster bacterium]|nr:hypothetical protein [SAR202 cluster bacterium]
MTTNEAVAEAVDKAEGRPFVAKVGPTMLTNEGKWRILWALEDYRRRYPPAEGTMGLTAAELVRMTGLSLKQVKGSLSTIYMTRNGDKSLLARVAGAATGNRTVRYVVTDRGRRWLQWAANTGPAAVFAQRWQQQQAAAKRAGQAR